MRAEEKSMLGTKGLMQVGSSLSADGLQPELRFLLYQNSDEEGLDAFALHGVFQIESERYAELFRFHSPCDHQRTDLSNVRFGSRLDYALCRC